MCSSSVLPQQEIYSLQQIIVSLGIKKLRYCIGLNVLFSSDYKQVFIKTTNSNSKKVLLIPTNSNRNSQSERLTLYHIKKILVMQQSIRNITRRWHIGLKYIFLWGHVNQYSSLPAIMRRGCKNCCISIYRSFMMSTAMLVFHCLDAAKEDISILPGWDYNLQQRYG